MDLVPVYAEEGSVARTNLPEGAFQITPEKQQLIGVRYGAAEFKAVGRTLRAVGRLAWDETKVTRVHPRVEGWIEEVFVDFIGKQVVKGSRSSASTARNSGRRSRVPARAQRPR